jgi:hypothetical protein
MKNLLKKAVGKTLALVKGQQPSLVTVKAQAPAKQPRLHFATPGNGISSQELTQRLNDLMKGH